MRPSHILIDEIDFFQQGSSNPLVDLYRYFEWGTDSGDNIRSIGMESWIAAETKNQAYRTYQKLKRRKEMENCQRGRMPFPIYWAAGVHPAGDRVARETEWISLGPFQAPNST